MARPASYVGTLTFDNFAVLPPSGETQPPSVSFASPLQNAVLSGVIQVQPNATDNVGVVQVTLEVDGIVRTSSTTSPFNLSLDTSTMSNGSHTLTLLAYDAFGNVGQSSITITTQNATALPVVTIPQHYSWIRIAELAYNGNPMGPTEQTLLQQSVDLVIPSTAYVNTIASVAPNTPQLLYTNVSSLYSNLLTDWLAYAYANGINPESAFYHVSSPTSYTGYSPSSLPVSWFWAVYRSGSQWANLTSQAEGSGTGGVAFGASGQSVDVGYPDPYCEINVALSTPAGAGWNDTLEYPTQVDANGNPTAWAPLPLVSDTTAGLTASGQIFFNPPANWVPASINGSARLYYVRFLTTGAGTAPVAKSILGMDYTNSNGSNSGVIPVFDYAADLNHDGYLDNAEYAVACSIGDYARFAYQSRAIIGQYGEMHFATNPSDPNFRNWAIQFNLDLLNSYPKVSGLFVDNSPGTAPVAAGSVLESTATYGADYASLLHTLSLDAAPRWLLVNSGTVNPGSDALLSQVTAYYEEFVIRPLGDNYTQFLDLASDVAHRMTLQSPAPYAVLNSDPIGGAPTDPRTQIATLAEYYLLADPNRTFLDFYGGYDPASSWTQHWCQAVTYDVGQPLGSWSLFASGTDPSNRSLTYQVYQRSYTNALVLYKPLSYGNGHTGTTADNTATVFQLNGTYCPLLADGTLGSPETSVSLRNGEGAILVKVSS